MWVLIKYKEPGDDTIYESVVTATSEDIGEDYFWAEMDEQAVNIVETVFHLFEDELPQWYQNL